MQVNIRQMNIKNRPDYLFNGNIALSIKDFDSNLLEINKLLFKGVFSFNIYYIKYSPTESSNRVNIDRTDNDEDSLYLFLDDADRHINNRIKYLVFILTEKNKEALKITKIFRKKLKD